MLHVSCHRLRPDEQDPRMPARHARRSVGPSAADGHKRTSMNNPYYGTAHGALISPDAIDDGLDHAFVLIGTMVLLKPSQQNHEAFVAMLEDWSIHNGAFGFRGW